MSKKTKPWEQFERLVAVIHTALDPNAKVTWNEPITGRQFDLTIRATENLLPFDAFACADAESEQRRYERSGERHQNRCGGSNSIGRPTCCGGRKHAANRFTDALDHTDAPREVLRGHGSRWNDRLEALLARLAALESRAQARDERIELLEEENRWLKAQLFGRSSEKTPAEERNPEQEWLFNEAEALARVAESAPQSITIPADERGKGGRKKLSRDAPPG